MEFLIRPMTYLAFIIMGCLFVEFKILADEDQKILKILIFRITLPCVGIQAFYGIDRSMPMIRLILLGFLITFCSMMIVVALFRKKDDQAKIFYILNHSGYNWGAFCLPVLSNFMGNIAAAAVCLLDIGNSLISLGINYPIMDRVLKRETRNYLKDSVLRLFQNVCFDTYLVMCILAVFNLSLPQLVFRVVEPMAQANPFLTMFLFGMMFKPRHWKKYIGDALKLMAMRNVIGIGIGAFLYFVLPFAQEIRQIIFLCCLAPTTVVASVRVGECGGDEKRSCFAGILNIIVSLIVLTVICSIMG